MAGSLTKLYNLIDAEGEEEIATAMGNLEPTHRELIESSQVNASALVKEEVYKKVVEGAEKVRCMRDVLSDATFDMPTPTWRMILHESHFQTLPEVPPTSEYPVAANESYRAITFTAKKYGELPVIEEELISDSMFGIVEMRLRDIGIKAENTLNQKAIDEVIANATADQNYSSGEPIASVAAAIRIIKDNGFSPDTLIMTAEMEGDMFNDPHFRYEYSGETGNFRSQELGKKILGLKPYLLTINSTNASFGGAIKGVVLDSSKTVGLGMKDDVTLDKFEDPKNDLLNLKVSMKFAVESLFKAAVNLSS